MWKVSLVFLVFFEDVGFLHFVLILFFLIPPQCRGLSAKFVLIRGFGFIISCFSRLFFIFYRDRFTFRVLDHKFSWLRS